MKGDYHGLTRLNKLEQEKEENPPSLPAGRLFQREQIESPSLGQFGVIEISVVATTIDDDDVVTMSEMVTNPKKP